MSDRGRAVGRLAVATCALLLAVGAALLGWGALTQYAAPQAQLTSAGQAEREAGPGLAVLPHAGQSPPRPAVPGPPTSAGASASSSVLPPSRPTSIEIPAIKVRSSLLHLGLDRNGALQVPQGADYDRAAWYTGSPTPGQRGPAVIEGHVDGAGDTPSVFFQIAALRGGDSVTVTRADQRRVTFEVYRVQRYAKNDFPTRAVYGNTTTPELRLITCGGDVDRHTGHHLDNTVVYARRVAVDGRPG